MKQTETKRLRGFTLLEMIVVLGIIAIISAIMVPAMNSYLTRSRLNTSNAHARVIFNSLQTICQEYEFSDRAAGTSVFYGPKTTNIGGIIGDATADLSNSSVTFSAEYGHITKVHTEIRYDGGSVSGLPVYYNSSGDSAFTPSWLRPGETMISRLDNPTLTTTLMQRMHRLFDDNSEICYVAMIENYQVVGVICAVSDNSDYIGGYPYKSTERGGFAAGSAPAAQINNAPFNTSKRWTMGEILGTGGTAFPFRAALENYEKIN